jgi:hypothetical protein
MSGQRVAGLVSGLLNFRAQVALFQGLAVSSLETIKNKQDAV